MTPDQQSDSADDPSGERTSSIRQMRAGLLDQLFGGRVPRLWCPTLTHYRTRGEWDGDRIQRHLEHVAPYAKGILVPGSTGEGWEMTDADIRLLLSVVLDAARSAGVHVLIGVLKHTVVDMHRCIVDTVDWLKLRTGTTTFCEAASKSSVVGFTVCPPKGADLTQEEIRRALAEILEEGLPTALYQLPQVTENEMTPATVSDLANRYANFFLFKDTSGGDRVANAELDLGGVFLVRGAEGAYARSTREGRGAYDGLLLSTANVFARQLYEIISLLEDGRGDEADAIASRIEPLVERTFAMVSKFEVGNAFTNANKVLDHLMAFGPNATGIDPPLLHSGRRLPAEFVRIAGQFLHESELLPQRGYMNERCAPGPS